MNNNYEICIICSDEDIDEDADIAEETANLIFQEHSAVLGRGFALASPPSVAQALDGVLPFR